MDYEDRLRLACTGIIRTRFIQQHTSRSLAQASLTRPACFRAFLLKAHHRRPSAAPPQPAPPSTFRLSTPLRAPVHAPIPFSSHPSASLPTHPLPQPGRCRTWRHRPATHRSPRAARPRPHGRHLRSREVGRSSAAPASLGTSYFVRGSSRWTKWEREVALPPTWPAKDERSCAPPWPAAHSTEHAPSAAPA